MSIKKGLTILKSLALALLIAGIVGQVWTLAMWNHYAAQLPRFPVPEQGRVYQLALHGIVVYQTAKEHTSFWMISNWSWVIFCIGFAAGIVYQWKSGELSKYFQTLK
jgi:hypothetical protein